MNTRTIFPVVMLFALLCAVAVPARAQSPQQTLSQYVADLQSNPNDTALRGKIIALAQSMRPAPAIPEEARGHYVMAATFVEQAKDNTGFQRAVTEYKAALLAAPWWADAYKKLAIAQKAANQYDDAIASLNLYLLAQPSDARDAQDEIYKLKALKQSSADDQARKQREDQQRAYESSPAGIAAKRQQRQQALVAQLNGTRFFCSKYNTITVQGNRLIFNSLFDDGVWRNTGDYALDGLVASYSGPCLYAQGRTRGYTFRAIISDDGQSLEFIGAGGTCGVVWTYRLYDNGSCSADEKCVDGSRVRRDGGEYCPE